MCTWLACVWHSMHPYTCKSLGCLSNHQRASYIVMALMSHNAPHCSGLGVLQIKVVVFVWGLDFNAFVDTELSANRCSSIQLNKGEALQC